MLYTSYLAKLDKLPSNMLKGVVTRFPPKWLNTNDYNNLYIVKELAPSKELLLKYKEDNNWDDYIKIFSSEMQNRKDMRDMLSNVLKYLQTGEDLMLICFEKDYTHCHRYLIAEYFIRFGIKWREW